MKKTDGLNGDTDNNKRIGMDFCHLHMHHQTLDMYKEVKMVIPGLPLTFQVTGQLDPFVCPFSQWSVSLFT